MKKNILICFALFLVVTMTATAQSVKIYKDCDYNGESFALYVGNYGYTQLGNVGNDNISSIRIPQGFTVTVYMDDAFRGESRTFTDNVPCVPADINDKISSIIVTKSGGSKYNKNTSNNTSYNRNMVTVFKDSNLSGESQSLGLGYHDYNGLGVGNDQISSIYIPEGFTVRVYTDGNYQGKSETYYSTVLQMYEINDQISSIIITKTSSNSNSNPSNSHNRKKYR